MAYNRVNKLRMYKKIVALTKEHYDPDVMSSYAKIHRLYIYPISCELQPLHEDNKHEQPGKAARGGREGTREVGRPCAGDAILKAD